MSTNSTAANGSSVVVWSGGTLQQIRLLLSGALLNNDIEFFHSAKRGLYSEALDMDSADGRTMLHEACEVGNQTFVQELIKSGVRLNPIERRTEMTPLLVALRHAHPNCADILITAGCDVDAVSVDGVTSLILAARHGFIDVMKRITRRGCVINSRTFSQGWSALHEAACGNHVECARFLLENGATVNCTEVDLISPLMLGCRKPQLVQLLLDYGANVNSCDREGDTALSLAVVTNSVDSVRLLLEHGANPQTHNYLHRSPLFLSTMHNSVQSALLLVKMNCMSKPDKRGRFPLGPMQAIYKDPLELAVYLRKWRMVKLFAAAGYYNFKTLAIGCERNDLFSFFPTQEHRLLTQMLQPLSLKRLARLAVNGQLPNGLAFRRAVDTLVCPAVLRRFLVFDDLDVFFDG